jgi:RNA-directed DNA polymerase
MTTTMLAPPVGVDDGPVMVNGPEGEVNDWLSMDWRRIEDDVRRLRQRIFTASRDGNLGKVRDLQKLMLRSRSNAVLSVRRVTELNAGRKTAGVDGRIVLHTFQKIALVDWVQHHTVGWAPLPVKRVYIPKSNGKQRPLGIPVIRDRVLQAVVLNALEPEWEARFEPRSYGFRPGRGCHDAIEAIFSTVAGASRRRRWVLDADLTAAFDRIDHQHLLASLAGFPGRELIASWLAAGVVEREQFTATLDGVPQGGVISPLLLNVALHGLGEAAGVRYIPDRPKQAAGAAPGTPVVIRYADDLVALCHSAQQAQQVKDTLTAWLAPRGLAFNEDKTQIVALEDGFDFLGFHIRRYPNGKTLIKPSKAAVHRIRRRLSTEVKALHGASVDVVIATLNPIIRGWAAYYRSVVSKDIFSALDDHVWKLTYQWAMRAHPNKGKRWVVAQYFGAFHPARKDHWIFGDRTTGRYVVYFSWIPIVRHTLVKGASSPDDPTLTDYWETRRRRGKPPLGPFYRRLLHQQHARCTTCGGLLLEADRPPQSPEEWEQWLTALRKAVRHKAITANDTSPNEQPCLMHTFCARRANAERRPAPAHPHA